MSRNADALQMKMQNADADAKQMQNADAECIADANCIAELHMRKTTAEVSNGLRARVAGPDLRGTPTAAYPCVYATESEVTWYERSLHF